MGPGGDVLPYSRSGRLDRLSGDQEALFVYGSLLFDDVLQALIGRVPQRIPATAPGWRVVALTGRVYPGLVPNGGSADGLLMTDLTPDEWDVLDAFEDDEYELRQLSLSEGHRGWAYVCGDGMEASVHEWDVEEFAERHLAGYIRRCTVWRERLASRLGGGPACGCPPAPPGPG